MLKEISISTSKKYEVVDITEEVARDIKKVKEGLCTVYVPHATAAIIVNENWDPNIGLDLQDKLRDLIPEGKYLHDKVDNNGAAHLKAAIIGPSESIPVKNGKLLLGQWQNICLCEFDGPKKRKVLIQAY